jgi:hypothetical protein
LLCSSATRSISPSRESEISPASTVRVMLSRTVEGRVPMVWVLPVRQGEVGAALDCAANGSAELFGSLCLLELFAAQPDQLADLAGRDENLDEIGLDDGVVALDGVGD